MLASFFRAADTDSTNIEGIVTDIEKKNWTSLFLFQGYVQVVGEMLFRVHLYCEQQIDLYVEYCKKKHIRLFILMRLAELSAD